MKPGSSCREDLVLGGGFRDFVRPSAVPAAAWCRCAEGAVAALAGLEGPTGLRARCGRGPGRRRGRELGGQAVGEESGRADQRLVRQILRQGVAYGGGGEVAFQPGGDTGCEVFGVGGGE